MNRRTILGITAVTALGLVALPVSAVAQQKSLKEQIVGTWLFVSGLDVHPDGRKVDRWGSNPKGLLIFTDNGRYSSHIVRADVPKFAAKNRLQGTPDENKAAVHGAIATFGKYTVDEAGKSFTYQCTGAYGSGAARGLARLGSLVPRLPRAEHARL
jgi:hypothetical protein